MINNYFAMKACLMDTSAEIKDVSGLDAYGKPLHKHYDATYNKELKEWFCLNGVIFGPPLSKEDLIEIHKHTYDGEPPITATVDSCNDGDKKLWLEFHPSARFNSTGDGDREMLFGIQLTPKQAIVIGRALIACGQMYLDSMGKDSE